MVSPTILHLLSSFFPKPDQNSDEGEMSILMVMYPAPAHSFMILGNPLVLRVAESRWGQMMTPGSSAPAFAGSLPPCLTCLKKGSRPRRFCSKCCAPLNLWTDGIVSWMQQTHRIYSRLIAEEDSRRSLTRVASECAWMFPKRWVLEAG